MNKGQGHGDHIGAIKDTNEFIKSHLRNILQNAKVHRKVRTNVVSESVKNEETRVFALLYGEGAIKWISLLAEAPGKANEFVTCFPVLEPVTKIKANIIGIEEWDNHVEATITCELDDGFEVSFFATDYTWNKRRYSVGLSMYIDLAALAYKAEEAEHGFTFEGQKAIDFLAKIGKEPTYDAEGIVEPVRFRTEKMIAFLQTDKEYPEDYQYQSPIYDLHRCESLGAEMYSCVIAFKNEPERYISLYLNSSKINNPEIGTPLRGLLWLQGKISENQLDEPAKIQFNNTISRGEIKETAAPLGEKAAEFVSTIDAKIENGELDNFTNLNWMLNILSEIKLDSKYDLDAFEVGDDHGARFQLYVCEANSSIEYKPDLEKRKERQRRLWMSMKEKEKAGTFIDNIIPYDDSMYISQMLDYKEAERIPEIWQYLKIPFTPMGIWQAYLLKDSYSLLPTRWHGGYNHRSYIFTKEDIDWLIDSKEKDLTGEDLRKLRAYKENEDILPQVKVSGNNAVVTYAYWNSWLGLNRCNLQVTKNGESISFGEQSSEKLISYDCGIRF